MPDSTSNLLLDSLPSALRDRLLAHSVEVRLPVRTSLYTPDRPPKYIHFITSGIASVVTSMSNGAGIEVGLNGRESAPESLHLLGPERGTSECFIQVASSGIRMEFKRFQDEFFSNPAIREIMFRHIQYQILIVGQMAACNRLHDVEERLARWLLMVSDRIGSLSFALTHEFLAEMIGSRRSTVTLTTGMLKQSGHIDYQRGGVTILDRKALEESACECYGITRTLYNNLQRDLRPGGHTNGASA